MEFRDFHPQIDTRQVRGVSDTACMGARGLGEVAF